MENLGIGSKELALSGTRSLADVAGSYTYFADGDVLLAKITPCFENGKLGIARNLVNGVGFGSSEYIVIRPGPEVDADFLYHFLDRAIFREDGAKQMTGAVGHKRVPKEYVEGALIPVPTIEEQQRIVSLLDEAFADIATAKANAEKNLQNARGIFVSHLRLVCNQNASMWTTTPFEDCVELVTYSTKVKRKDFLSEGLFPIVSQEEGLINGWWKNEADLFKVDRPVVLFGDHTRKFKYVDFDFVLGADGVKILKPKEFLHPRFFYYQLHTAKLQSLGYARHFRLLKEHNVSYPSLKEQLQIVKKLDALEEEALQLESIYHQKLSALDDLKKSLLHQAFSGQL